MMKTTVVGLGLALSAACGFAEDSLIVPPGQQSVAPSELKSIQMLKNDVPIYAVEKQGPWEREVGGPLREDSHELGMQMGWGHSIIMGGTKHNYSYAFANPRFGWVFTDLIGEDFLGGFFKGNGEVVLEGVFGYALDGAHNGTEGLALMYKHNFITGTRFVPFVELGNGLSLNQWNIYETQSDFEFISQVGGGLQYFFNDSWALITEIRWHHMSNAGLTSPNPGLNSYIATTGVTHFF